MVYPFDNLHELGWKPVQGDPSLVTRSLAGPELVLDQIRRLNDGMSDIVSGIRISHNLAPSILTERLLESWLRLRFYSPLIAAEIIRGPEPEELGSWLYKPVDLQGAKKWRDASLHFHPIPEGQLDSNRIDSFVRDTSSIPLPFDGSGGSLFCGHVLIEEGTTNAVLLVHACHVILDGPALLDCLYLILEYAINPERSASSEQLDWGKEVKNLPPHPVEMYNVTLDDWETDGMTMLKEFDRVLAGKPSHTLKSQRKEASQPIVTSKVSYCFSVEDTDKIMHTIKSLQSTVTVAVEAAHILVTVKLNPPTDLEGRTVLFPSIIATRHLLQPPWNQRTTLVITGGAIPLIAEHSRLQIGTEYDKMTALMKVFKSQYVKWLAIPHHPLLVPAQSAINPIMDAIARPDAEITNLGIIERRLPLGWTSQSRIEESECLTVKDFFLGLRRPAPVLMTHVWTFDRSLRIQCQGNDSWDVEFMQRFLQEIVRLVSILALEQSSFDM